jgi:hypothetical protein
MIGGLNLLRRCNLTAVAFEGLARVLRKPGKTPCLSRMGVAARLSDLSSFQWPLCRRFYERRLLNTAELLTRHRSHRAYCPVSRRILAISSALRFEALVPKRVVT